MSPPSYYFVNHTCKEFCYFDENVQIFQELINVVNVNEGWTIYDEIKVDVELYGDTHLIEYLTNELNYKNLNYDPEPDSES